MSKSTTQESALPSFISSNKNYINGIASITSGLQQKIYQKMSELAVDIPKQKVVSKNHPIIKKALKGFGKHYRVMQKQCFRNAHKVCQFSTDFEYVEGFINSVIPIEHAWNYHKPSGLYIDLTAETHFDLESEYTKVISISNYELTKLLIEAKFHESIMARYAHNSLN